MTDEGKENIEADIPHPRAVAALEAVLAVMEKASRKFAEAAARRAKKINTPEAIDIASALMMAHVILTEPLKIALPTLAKKMTKIAQECMDEEEGKE